MEETKIEIVCCADKWYVMPTGVMMYSVCVNNPDVEIVFHVIHDDSVTSRNRSDLEDTVAGFGGKSVVFYNVDVTKFPCFPHISIGSHVTQASYYRLLLPEILPTSVRKVLYMDGDIIVRHSLLPLWNTDLKDSAVGVVLDVYKLKENSIRLKLSSQYDYFNAGVMLANLEYWREHNVVNELFDILQKYSDKLIQHDQDILNIAFSCSKVLLPIKYNLTSGFLWNIPQEGISEKEWKDAIKDPVVLHITAGKPWTYGRSPNYPYSSTFFKYQSQTKWKGVKTDKRPFKLRVINFVADTLRKFGLMPQPSDSYEFIDVAPID